MQDVFSSTNSLVSQFKNSKVIHFTDNKGVVSIFTIGSLKKQLQSMVANFYRSCNYWNIKIHFSWKPRESPVMQLVDLGSRGPWLDYDNFTVDKWTAKLLCNCGINLDAFASFHNRLCDRYFSLGFQLESSSTNYFAQHLIPSDIVLLHLYPSILYNALLHASSFIYHPLTL